MAEAQQTQATRSTSDEQFPSGGQSSSQATQGSETAHDQSRGGHGGKHVHHGRTPAAWVGSMTSLVGFLLGGTAGVGTVLFAVAVGPLIQFFLPRVAVPITVPDRQPQGAVGRG